MNIEEMHYDYKQKLNKIDSQQYRNLKVPEIDWKLNEAISLFVKIVAEPKYATRLGFETSQRVIDDIRTLVVDDRELQQSASLDQHDLFVLPDGYAYYVGTSELLMKQGTCEIPADRIIVRQHDDDFQASLFDKSSFLWREVNIWFFKDGIKVFNSGEFSTEKFAIDFIAKPASVNNCESYPGGSYRLPGIATPLTQNVDCNLPEHTHREIVDLAVAITTGDLQIPDYQIKKDKLNYNQLV